MHISDILFDHAAKKYSIIRSLQESTSKLFSIWKNPQIMDMHVRRVVFHKKTA